MSPETPPIRGSPIRGESLRSTPGLRFAPLCPVVTLAVDNRVVIEQPRPKRETGFRWLLALQALISIATGIWGIVWIDMLETVFGLQAPGDAAGFDALARLYGAAMLALGLGYALAAAQPHGSRGLLAVLFMAPILTAVVIIAGVARGEISAARGVVFTIYLVAYCFLFFRTYPRLDEKKTGPPELRYPD